MPAYYEETLSSSEIFKGRVFTITVDEARLANGSVHRREVVHHSGGAGVVALNRAGEVALVRQFRYAVGREMLEIPAGKMEPGEPPEHCARRELREEAGVTAARFAPFGGVLPTCAYCTERIYIYLATRLEDAPRDLDEDELLDVLWLPLDEAVQRVMDGGIDDAKTVSALLRAKMLLDAGKILL